MTDLLDHEAVAFIRADVFVRFSKQGIEGFGDAIDRGGVFTCSESGDIEHTLSGVCPVGRCIKKLGIFHVFCHALQERRGLVQGYWKCHFAHVFSNHVLESVLSDVSKEKVRLRLGDLYP